METPTIETANTTQTRIEEIYRTLMARHDGMTPLQIFALGMINGVHSVENAIATDMQSDEEGMENYHGVTLGILQEAALILPLQGPEGTDRLQ